MTATDPTVRTAVPFRTSSTVLALVLPLTLLAASAIVALSWRDELPDPVATHWGTDGPNGFSSLAGAFVPVLIGVALSVGAWLIAVRWGRDGATRRIAVGVSAGLSVLLAVITVGSLAVQRGLDDAAQAGDIGGIIAVAFLVAAAVGALVGRLAPKDPPRPTTARVDVDAARVPLNATQKAAWSRTATSPTTLVAALVAITTTAVLTFVAGAWVVLVVPVLLTALLAVTLVWQVTVDERGLTARSALGWPAIRVPLDEVERADVIHVRPFREFGGWGYRLGRGGRAALALRGGEALEVHRTGARVLVVTVDDAATGAALLNTLADRSRI